MKDFLQAFGVTIGCVIFVLFIVFMSASADLIMENKLLKFCMQNNIALEKCVFEEEKNND